LSAATTDSRADDAELADLVSRGAAELGLPLGRSEVHRLIAFVRLIERWNTTYNLTAVRDPRNMVVQHILDCLAAAAALGRRRGEGRGERLVDVGSGAGLPGVVIAIAFPDREITCIDSVGKKAAFITQAAGTLGLEQLGRLQVYLVAYVAIALLVSLWVLPGLVAALTPIRVKDVLDLLAAGASRDEILADYPYLEDEDITAVLEFAARQNDHPVVRSA